MTHGAAPIMPRLLREVADALGRDAAIKLAETYGGQKIYVHQRTPEHSELRKLLGPDLHDFLAGHWDGPYFTIPKFEGLRTEERRQTVLNNPDLSANALAARLKITARRVEQIRQAARSGNSSPSLFDAD